METQLEFKFRNKEKQEFVEWAGEAGYEACVAIYECDGAIFSKGSNCFRWGEADCKYYKEKFGDRK